MNGFGNAAVGRTVNLVKSSFSGGFPTRCSPISRGGVVSVYFLYALNLCNCIAVFSAQVVLSLYALHLGANAFGVGLVAAAFYTHQILVSLGIALVVGVLGGVLVLFALRFVGAALLAAAGVLLAQGLALPWWAVLIAAIVGGVVGFLANKLMIAIATSAIGAWLAVNSGLTLAYDLGVQQIPNESWIVLASTLLVAVLGIVVQMRHVRKHGGWASDDAAAAS